MPDSKLAAQRRADRIAAFRAELDELEREGVAALSADARAAVARHHDALLSQLAERFDVDVAEGEKQLSLGMRIASLLGAAALAASAFLLFRRVWGLISTPAQVAVLLAAPVLSLLATDFAARRERSGYFAALLGAVAVACFVLDLTMLGRIFNMAPSLAAVLAWSAFALLLAYAYGLRLVLAAGLAAFAVWLAAWIFTWSDAPWPQVGERPETFLPAGALLFALPAVAAHRHDPEFAPAYRICGLLALLLPMLILGHWGDGSFLPLAKETVENVYLVLGLVVCAAAIWLGVRRQWRDTVNLASTFFIVFLYAEFFDWWWDWMPKYLFFLIVGLTAVAALVLLKRLRAMAAPAVEAG